MVKKVIFYPIYLLFIGQWFIWDVSNDKFQNCSQVPSDFLIDWIKERGGVDSHDQYTFSMDLLLLYQVNDNI